MQLRNKKQLPEMTHLPPNPNAATSNVASASGTTTNPPVPSGTTQSTQSSTTETVIEPVGSTRAAQTSQAVPTTTMAASTFQVDPIVSVAAETSQAIPTSGMASSQGLLNIGTCRRMLYGMPTSFTPFGYPMPVAEMVVDSAAGFKYLGMLDGYLGYNQIFIVEEDVSKTAFRCPGALGCYEWLVMPFGLKNAGATYQRAINSMFHDFIEDFMQVYIDDIVVK